MIRCSSSAAKELPAPSSSRPAEKSILSVVARVVLGVVMGVGRSYGGRSYGGSGSELWGRVGVMGSYLNIQHFKCALQFLVLFGTLPSGANMIKRSFKLQPQCPRHSPTLNESPQNVKCLDTTPIQYRNRRKRRSRGMSARRSRAPQPSPVAVCRIKLDKFSRGW